MATIETKYSVGDVIYCRDKKGLIRERKIMGIRTQELLGGVQKTMYSFLKDFAYTQDYLQQGHPVYSGDDFFWMSENHIFNTKYELINSEDEQVNRF